MPIKYKNSALSNEYFNQSLTISRPDLTEAGVKPVLAIAGVLL